MDTVLNTLYSGHMKNSRNNELAVCGFEAVKALAKVHPDNIKRLYFSKERAFAFGDICKQLAAKKRPYNMVESADELEKLCGSVHHQGVVAMIEQPKIQALNTDITTEWLHKKESALLLDRVGNANNLGAIVRSAAFFGFKNIIIPLDEAQSSITTSSYRVAQGGMEFVNIYTVRSITKLLIAMQGKMLRLGTAVDTTTPISDISRLSGNKSILIVLGNEEHGISREVKALCDTLVTIPAGRASADSALDADEGGDGLQQPIESLNVAQAAAIILYECRKR